MPFHYTPVGSWWLNQVEVWFGIITRQTIRGGTFGSLRILIDVINAYIENWNADASPLHLDRHPGRHHHEGPAPSP